MIDLLLNRFELVSSVELLVLTEALGEKWLLMMVRLLNLLLVMESFHLFVHVILLAYLSSQLEPEVVSSIVGGSLRRTRHELLNRRFLPKE